MKNFDSKNNNRQYVFTYSIFIIYLISAFDLNFILFLKITKNCEKFV